MGTHILLHPNEQLSHPLMQLLLSTSREHNKRRTRPLSRSESYSYASCFYILFQEHMRIGASRPKGRYASNSWIFNYSLIDLQLGTFPMRKRLLYNKRCSREIDVRIQ